MDKKLFIITNRKLVKKRSLTDVIDRAVKGGADAVILREKDLSTEELYKLALELKLIINNKIPLIINGNLEVYENIAASGIHLSYDEFMKCEDTNYRLIGSSIHSLEEGLFVQKKGADYVLAGHIFKTACKQGIDGRGLDYLQQICNELRIPVIAIGGIEKNNVKSIIEAGAFGIAVMSSVMEAEKPEKVVYDLKEALSV